MVMTIPIPCPFKRNRPTIAVYRIGRYTTSMIEAVIFALPTQLLGAVNIIVLLQASPRYVPGSSHVHCQ